MYRARPYATRRSLTAATARLQSLRGSSTSPCHVFLRIETALYRIETALYRIQIQIASPEGPFSKRIFLRASILRKSLSYRVRRNKRRRDWRTGWSRNPRFSTACRAASYANKSAACNPHIFRLSSKLHESKRLSSSSLFRLALLKASTICPPCSSPDSKTQAIGDGLPLSLTQAIIPAAAHMAHNPYGDNSRCCCSLGMSASRSVVRRPVAKWYRLTWSITLINCLITFRRLRSDHPLYGPWRAT